jgi:hypothetical protein
MLSDVNYFGDPAVLKFCSMIAVARTYSGQAFDLYDARENLHRHRRLQVMHKATQRFTACYINCDTSFAAHPST